MATRKISSAAETAEVSFVKRCPKEIQQLYRADMANLRPEHRGAKAEAEEDAPAPAHPAGKTKARPKKGGGDIARELKIARDEVAAMDPLLSELDRAVYDVMVETALRVGVCEVLAGSKWMADQVEAPRRNVQRSYRRLERLAYIWRWQKDPETGKMNFALPRITADALRRSPPGSKPAVFRVRRPQVPKSDPFKA